MSSQGGEEEACFKGWGMVMGCVMNGCVGAGYEGGPISEKELGWRRPAQTVSLSEGRQGEGGGRVCGKSGVKEKL